MFVVVGFVLLVDDCRQLYTEHNTHTPFGLDLSSPSFSFPLKKGTFHHLTMNKTTSSKSLSQRPVIGAPSYRSSLKGLQEQALLHRICAEVMSSSSTNRRVFVAPHRADDSSSSSWVRPERVLEILDGALCIAIDDGPLVYRNSSVDSTPLSYQNHTSTQG